MKGLGDSRRSPSSVGGAQEELRRSEKVDGWVSGGGSTERLPPWRFRSARRMTSWSYRSDSDDRRHPNVVLPAVTEWMAWMACGFCYDDPFRVAVGSSYEITVR